MSNLEQQRATPEVTPGYMAERVIKALVNNAVIPTAESVAAQTATISAESAISAAVWGGPALSLQESFQQVVDLQNEPLAVAAAAFTGGYLSTKAKNFKENEGIAPEGGLREWIWKRAIEVQLTSFSIACAKTALTLKETLDLMSNTEHAGGILLSVAGGALALVDNLVHMEKRVYEKMALPTASLTLGVVGFALSPVEAKPQMAGFAVAAIGNFIENTAEMLDDDWRDKLTNSLSKRLDFGRTAERIRKAKQNLQRKKD